MDKAQIQNNAVGVTRFLKSCIKRFQIIKRCLRLRVFCHFARFGKNLRVAEHPRQIANRVGNGGLPDFIEHRIERDKVFAF